MTWKNGNPCLESPSENNLNRHQAPVVQRLDNAIQWISANKTNHAIHWIVIYPVATVIHLLNNRGQDWILK